MTPRLDPIASMWLGARLSTMEQICLSSFVYHGHSTTLYVYDSVEGIPSGVTVVDANSIVDRSEIFVNRKGSYAGFADLFRWELLRQRPVIWVDTDVICLRPFTFQRDYLFGLQDEATINIAVIGLPLGSKVCTDLARMCREPHAPLPYDGLRVRARKFIRRYLQGDRRGNIGWGEGGGVHAFSQYAQHHGLFSYALPMNTFYPIGMHDWRSFLDGTLRLHDERLYQSHAVHLWNEFFRRNQISKDAPFPAGSFLDDAVRTFL